MVFIDNITISLLILSISRALRFLWHLAAFSSLFIVNSGIFPKGGRRTVSSSVTFFSMSLYFFPWNLIYSARLLLILFSSVINHRIKEPMSATFF